MQLLMQMQKHRHTHTCDTSMPFVVIDAPFTTHIRLVRSDTKNNPENIQYTCFRAPQRQLASSAACSRILEDKGKPGILYSF
jgi:hypothetical protein